MIVDVRDEDRVGGHIDGSHYHPSDGFEESVHELRRTMVQSGSALVVFYCMNSQVQPTARTGCAHVSWVQIRGRLCAGRLQQLCDFYAKKKAAPGPDVRMCVPSRPSAFD